MYAERHRPRGVGLAGAVHRTWAVAEKNDWQFSNPRIDTVSQQSQSSSTSAESRQEEAAAASVTKRENNWVDAEIRLLISLTRLEVV